MRISLNAWTQILGALAPVLLICGVAFAADSETEFRAAYAAADAAEKQAGLLHNQWIATETALTESRAAAEKADFDQAAAVAKEAEALAKASVYQARSEKEAWKAEVIR